MGFVVEPPPAPRGYDRQFLHLTSLVAFVGSMLVAALLLYGVLDRGAAREEIASQSVRVDWATTVASQGRVYALTQTSLLEVRGNRTREIAPVRESSRLLGVRQGIAVLIESHMTGSRKLGDPLEITTTLTSIDVKTGATAWRQQVAGGGDGTAAMDEVAVYLADPSHRLTAYRIADGARLWVSAVRTALSADIWAGHGRVYVTDEIGSPTLREARSIAVLDAASGNMLGGRAIDLGVSRLAEDGSYVAFSEKGVFRDEMHVLSTADGSRIMDTNHMTLAVSSGYAFGIAVSAGSEPGESARRLDVFDLTTRRQTLSAQLPPVNSRVLDEDMLRGAWVGDLGPGRVPVILTSEPDTSFGSYLSPGWNRVVGYSAADGHVAFMKLYDGPVDVAWVQDGYLYLRGPISSRDRSHSRMTRLALTRHDLDGASIVKASAAR